MLISPQTPSVLALSKLFAPWLSRVCRCPRATTACTTQQRSTHISRGLSAFASLSLYQGSRTQTRKSIFPLLLRLLTFQMAFIFCRWVYSGANSGLMPLCCYCLVCSLSILISPSFRILSRYQCTINDIVLALTRTATMQYSATSTRPKVWEI